MLGAGDESSGLIGEKRPSGLAKVWRNKQLRALILLVVALFALAVTLAVVATSTHHDSEPELGRPFDFDSAFNSSLSPKYAGVKWIAGLNAYSAVESGSIVQYTLAGNASGAGERSVLADAKDLVDPDTGKPLAFQSYLISPNHKHIVFTKEHEKLYRHSSYDVYLLYSVDGRSFFKLAQGASLRYAELSPTGDKIAYVKRDNNLYVYDLALNVEHQVTFDGEVNSVINGVCDWAYEEEVFSRTQAVWWSPDGVHLAFMRFAEADVSTYDMTVYRAPYNLDYKFKYPQPGFPNSNVSMMIYNTNAQNTVVAELGGEWDQYIIEATYFGNDVLAMRTMPRLQNSWKLFAVSVSDGSASQLSSERSATYLEPHAMLTFLPELNAYVDIMVKDDYNHLALFNANTGERKLWLTSGAWGVEAFLGVNLNTNIIYFTSTELSSIDRAVWAVSAMDGSRTQLVQSPNADKRTYQTASFATTGQFFVLNEQSGAPSSKLYSTGDSGKEARLVHTLKENSAVLSALSSFALPTQRFFSIPAEYSVSGVPLNGYMLLPPGFDEHSCNKQYPVLVNVYGGPGNQQVSSKFAVGAGGPGFHTYLVSSLDYIVVVFDGVGTGGKGDDFQKKYTYQTLGVNEAKDVVSGLRYLQSLCYVRKDRVALWGWSFGGFLSSMVAGFPEQAASGLPHFHSVMAVAPVADWRLYDSIYTERYMRQPSDNAHGYNVSSVFGRFDNFNCNYLLVHGTGDDNVHFQNGALIAQGLVERNFQFDTMFYTNRDHSLRGPNGEDNPHLYKFLSNYLQRTMA